MDKKEMKFEDKISELETIIDDLENGNIDLDLSIQKYTRAMILIKECDAQLKKIEGQVNKMVLEDNSTIDFDLGKEKSE